MAVTVRNPADPRRAWTGDFLIDTGATDSCVPRRHLSAIGLAPRGQRTYEMADGSSRQLDVTTAELEFMGEIGAGAIVMTDADDEPLLGATALASAGIEVDPGSQRLRKLPAVRL